MRKIHEEFEGDTGLDKNSDADELRSFMEHILPEYDQDKVYVSDMKKLVTWYNFLAKNYAEVFEAPEEEASEAERACHAESLELCPEQHEPGTSRGTRERLRRHRV